jgi:hypothetical protein
MRWPALEGGYFDGLSSQAGDAERPGVSAHDSIAADPKSAVFRPTGGSLHR